MNPVPVKSQERSKKSLVQKVQTHYDQLALMYRLFWGPHVHHGYWDADEHPRRAQERLIEELVRRAAIKPGSRVLDVGCGTGGSSLWLAKNLKCSVVGVNISPIQISLARQNARLARLSGVTFVQKDAALLREFPAGSFDVVWTIECSEHLADKQQFVSDAARLLKPDGIFAVCAWLRGPSPDKQLLEEVCDSMICPGLGRMEDYIRWMSLAGLQITSAENITRKVQKTWEYCMDLLKKAPVRAFLKISSHEIKKFAASFPLMLKAFTSQTMTYGMITAKKTSKN